MISITYEQTQLKQFEGLQSVKYGIDKLRIDILKLRYLWSLVNLDLLVLIFIIYSDQGLISFELLKELKDRAVDDGDDIDNFLHDLILHENVALCFDDLDIEIIVLFGIVNY